MSTPKDIAAFNAILESPELEEILDMYYRPATESEMREYLAGNVVFEYSRETENGLEIGEF